MLCNMKSSNMYCVVGVWALGLYSIWTRFSHILDDGDGGGGGSKWIHRIHHRNLNILYAYLIFIIYINKSHS